MSDDNVDWDRALTDAVKCLERIAKASERQAKAVEKLAKIVEDSTDVATSGDRQGKRWVKVDGYIMTTNGDL